MKSKLRNLLLAAMALTLFAGCSNIALNDASYEGSDAGDKCVLTISYDDLEGFIPSSVENVAPGSARTIDPGKLTVDTTIKFSIEGKTNRGTKLAQTEITFTDDTDAGGVNHGKKASVSLSYDEWYLTLKAYTGEIGNESYKELLRGVTSVNLKKAPPAKLTFNLSTKDVDTKGSLKLTFNGLTDVVKSYTAGLYNPNTDKLEYDLLAEGDKGNLAADKTSVTLEKNEIKPGSYIVKFVPYNDTFEHKDSREDLTPWSDVITIAPGRETNAAVTISVMTKPEAPTGFSVSLVEASENDKDDYYTVRLNWTDNSDNEENFVLRIYKATGNEDDVEQILVEEKKVVEFNKINTFVGSDYYVSKTLGMSTETCDVKLRTGQLYEMTLAASNRAGESEAVKRDASVDGSGTKGFAITTSTITTDDEGHEITTTTPVTVNRQKITYNLVGGTRTQGTGDTAVKSTEDVVEYRTYGTAYSLWEPNSTDDTLIYNNHSWSGWVEKSNTNETASISDYKDKTVYAKYDTNLLVGYEIVNEYMTLQIEPSTTTNGVTVSTTTLTLDTRENDNLYAGNIKFTVSATAKHRTGVDENNNPTYENVTIEPAECQKIIVYVDGKKVGERVGEHDYDVSLNWFNSVKTYNVSVIGVFNGREYSCEPLKIATNIIVE